MDIKKALEEVNIDVERIADPAVKTLIVKLLNIIESLAAENKQLREENQKLRDENNRLKGEKGKPQFRQQTRPSQNYSSEKERNKRNQNRKEEPRQKKKDIVEISRVETCRLDKSQLPGDAIFKGYSNVIVQDIVIKTNNIHFQKAIYYSPSLKKTFVASLPNGYEGKFGPFLKSLILELHHASGMTEPALVQFLSNHGVVISNATISRMMTKKQELFHQEKEAIVKAGLPSSVYQQMDDTGARVNGKNHYTHILCNPYYTAYFTRMHKDRLTVLEILTQGELTFRLNGPSYELMKYLGLPNKTLDRLTQRVTQEAVMQRTEMDELLRELFPDPTKYSTNRRIILEASAIMAYQQLPHAAPLLLTDDAPQFKQITKFAALCWVHDGRHYKKLDPIIQYNRKKVDCFLDRYWTYYHQLLSYKKSPTINLANSLSKAFDKLFSTQTGYTPLDERIAKTKMKKDSLLLMLKHPELPLHNNASELGARKQARYRDISLQTKNENGTEAKDTFMTLIETAKKLGVNTFRYLFDRVSKKYEMPSLANLIKLRSDNFAYNTS
jgi:regulator of replication initiation timing